MESAAMEDALKGLILAAARGLSDAVAAFKEEGISTTLQYFKLQVSYQWITEFTAQFAARGGIKVWFFSADYSLSLTSTDKQSFTVTIEAQLVPLTTTPP